MNASYRVLGILLTFLILNSSFQISNCKAQWVQVSNGMGNQYVYSLATSGNNIFAGTDANGVYLSTNNGTSWTQTSLNSQIVQSLALNGNYVFAGISQSGVYVSTNNGTSWTQRNESLGNLNIFAFCMLNNYIFAGTAGNSVYRRPLSELIGIKPISEQIPANFSLEQNYPNPFNPTTKIRFDIPSNVKHQTSIVRIIIYDILGREAAVLVNESLKPGSYEVEWNATNYPSGLYYYKFTADNYINTKKMVLVK